MSKKIFITGYSGCGKTILKGRIASENEEMDNFNFDAKFDYSNLEDATTIFNLINSSDSFVIDAIPFEVSSDKGFNFDRFKKFSEENDIEVIITVCSNFEDLVGRIVYKPYFVISNTDIRKKFLSDFIPTNNNLLSLLDSIKCTPKYFDSFKNEYVSKDRFLEILESMTKSINDSLLQYNTIFDIYLSTLKYDKNYQDIEFINKVGYSKSYKTWGNIKDLIKWEGKSIFDMGCFHCYFSIKVKEMGAFKVYGLDNNANVIGTARIINKILQNNIEVLKWEAGEPTPETDIGLCLNVLHHAIDAESALKNMNCKKAIFEIEKRQVAIVKKYFNILKEVKSHREDASQDRIILLAEKIQK